MAISTSNRLKKCIDEIMDTWEKRVNEEIKAAHHQETFALRDSLPEYLAQLVDALSKTIDRTSARKKADKVDSTRVGKKHGKDRAGSINYTMDQMISEYHILRQVIFDVLEKNGPVNDIEREVIVCSVEQAVNDAATEFSDVLKDIKENMSQTLAHDLRNPLTTAKISTQMILRRPDNLENCIDKANLISKSLDRIDAMISDLLDVSRIKAGEKLALEFKECDLDWILREVANESNMAIEGRFNVRSNGKCIGMWNENGLRRMIENLATNAVKYGQLNGPITISIEDDEESATIRVHNLGEPIPTSEQAVIFQKFKRSTVSEEKAGWGLGLTVVKGMVDAHKGTIKVESVKDHGTTFIIKLPKGPNKNLAGGKVSRGAKIESHSKHH